METNIFLKIYEAIKVVNDNILAIADNEKILHDKLDDIDRRLDRIEERMTFAEAEPLPSGAERSDKQ